MDTCRAVDCDKEIDGFGFCCGYCSTACLRTKVLWSPDEGIIEAIDRLGERAMDKIEPVVRVGLPNLEYQVARNIDKLDELVDWLTAHEQETKARDLIDCHEQLKAQREAGDFTLSDIVTKPSIVQELEAGLIKHEFEDIYRVRGRKGIACTYILLPAAEWEAYLKSLGTPDIWHNVTIHDIPVYSYSGDSVKFCTD